MKAIWNGAVIAESVNTRLVEGNHYFPPEAVRREYLKRSDMLTVCPVKGRAFYYDLVVDGEVNPDAAWSYPAPKPQARFVLDHVAFWRGVTIEE